MHFLHWYWQDENWIVVAILAAIAGLMALLASAIFMPEAWQQRPAHGAGLSAADKVFIGIIIAFMAVVGPKLCIEWFLEAFIRPFQVPKYTIH